MIVFSVIVKPGKQLYRCLQSHRGKAPCRGGCNRKILEQGFQTSVRKPDPHPSLLGTNYCLSTALSPIFKMRFIWRHICRWLRLKNPLSGTPTSALLWTQLSRTVGHTAALVNASYFSSSCPGETHSLLHPLKVPVVTPSTRHIQYTAWSCEPLGYAGDERTGHNKVVRILSFLGSPVYGEGSWRGLHAGVCVYLGVCV